MSKRSAPSCEATATAAEAAHDAPVLSDARSRAAVQVCKLRRLAGSTPGEARCAARAVASLVQRHGLDEAALAAGEALDAAGTRWECERVLTERPPREMLLLQLQNSGRTLRNAAGTSAGEELGIGFGNPKSAPRAALRAHTRFDLASRECAGLTLGALCALAGGARLETLFLGRPACGRSSAGGELAAAIAETHYATARAPDVLSVLPEAAMTLTLRALLGDGDLVVCQWPCAGAVPQLLADLGCRVLLWRPEAAGARGLTYSLRTLEALLASSSPAIDPRAVVLAMPSDPLGWLPSVDEWMLLLDACKRRGAYVIADETYALLTPAPHRLRAVADAYDLGISLGSLSGAGLPALRCGWVACTNRALLARVDEMHSEHCDSSLCSPNDALSLAALQPAAWRALMRHSCDTLSAHAALLEAFFARHAATFAWTRPLAGCTAAAQLVGDRALSACEFCDRLCRAYGVLLSPVDASNSGVRGAQRFPSLWLVSFAFGGAHFPEALRVIDGALTRLGPTLGVLTVLGDAT
jgi:aspartate/methionine/tyrosine aminotransferase